MLYINDLPQAIRSNLLLYGDDTCIVPQYKDGTEIEKQVLRDFSGFVTGLSKNKLSVHLCQDKTKSILIGTKHILRNIKTLNIVCYGIEIKQYKKVKYLECVLDQTLSGESMTTHHQLLHLLPM